VMMGVMGNLLGDHAIIIVSLSLSVVTVVVMVEGTYFKHHRRHVLMGWRDLPGG